MKRTILLCLWGLLVPFVASAQADDDFDSFLQGELDGFDRFIDEADRDFINFMREPWKEYDAKTPQEKRVKPEPVTPVYYDPTQTPAGDKPVQLSIEEILDLTTGEGRQKPVTQVNDVDDIDFGQSGGVIVKPEDNSPVVIIEEVEEETPVQEPSGKPGGKESPAGEEPVEDDTPPVTPPVPEEDMPDSSGQAPQAEGGASLRVAKAGTVRVDYMGQTFYLDDELKGACRLSGLKENDMADAYENLYGTRYANVLDQCAKLGKELRLNGWGMYTLLRSVADACTDNANESVAMQQFLLNTMGYKARVGREDGRDKLLLFVGIDCMIYGMPYVEEGGLHYYLVNAKEPCRFYMCQQDAPSAVRGLDMYLGETVNLTGSTSRSTHTGKLGGMTATVDVPDRLMAFYKAYPQCDYGVYATAAVNAGVERGLLGALAPRIQGKSQLEAVNLLLNFVQTGFEYATDDEQFGYEKPFFVEEAFYYPYCDCEDRSILFAYLVRQLVGLDVVYLDYPDHIATAVRFTGAVRGDYLVVDGQRYTVCDPTYIGASVGMTMPAYRSVSAKVLQYH